MKIFEGRVPIKTAEILKTRPIVDAVGVKSYDIENDPDHKLIVMYETQKELEESEKGR